MQPVGTQVASSVAFGLTQDLLRCAFKAFRDVRLHHRKAYSIRLTGRPDFLEASPNEDAIFIMNALLKRPRTF